MEKLTSSLVVSLLFICHAVEAAEVTISGDLDSNAFSVARHLGTSEFLYDAVPPDATYELTFIYDEFASPSTEYIHPSSHNVYWWLPFYNLEFRLYDSAGNQVYPGNLIPDTFHHASINNYRARNLNTGEYFERVYISIYGTENNDSGSILLNLSLLFSKNGLGLIEDMHEMLSFPSKSKLDVGDILTRIRLSGNNYDYVNGLIYYFGLPGNVTDVFNWIIDSDGDGVPDPDDAFPEDPTESEDSDGDGVGDNGDVFPGDPTESRDTDGDGVGNNSDAFPFNSSEWTDADGDGYGDNGDAFPQDNTEWADTDGDGVGDNTDAFPNDPDETVDSDLDGHGDNSDAFPNDATEWLDTDGDGVGDNADVFPNDPNETHDSDGDGRGDNGDVFPNDGSEWADSDSDGVGDNADAFPNDPAETTDSDGDGVGDNGDVFPSDPTESADADHDGVGDNTDQNDASDLSATVSIGGVDSGVENSLYANGETLADLITSIVNQCVGEASNHGQFVSCAGDGLDALRRDGVISGQEKGTLQSIAAKQ